MGKEVVVRVGEVIPYERLAQVEDRQHLMNILREATYALGKDLPRNRVKAPK